MKKIKQEHWDYSWNGIYFVTLKTEYNRKIFGKIAEGKMILNSIGNIANHCWQDIPNHYNHLYLDEYIIMPDHIHGVLRIDNPEQEHGYYLRKRKMKGIMIKEYDSGENPSLFNIIGSYKSACSRIIRQTSNYTSFKWQKQYYIRIICHDMALMRIREYIKNNP